MSVVRNVVEISPSRARLIQRLAIEGVPQLAICRAAQEVYGVVHRVLREALSAGIIVAMPPRDWPSGPSRLDRMGPTLDDLDPDDVARRLKAIHGLYPAEAMVLGELLRRGFVTRQRLHSVASRSASPESDPETVRVHVSRLRRKTGQALIFCESGGYRIHEDDRARLTAEVMARAGVTP